MDTSISDEHAACVIRVGLRSSEMLISALKCYTVSQPRMQKSEAAHPGENLRHPNLSQCSGTIKLQATVKGVCAIIILHFKFKI
jgi:hypothetical protein